MPYFYEYRGDDQDLVVESDEPRPDLLEWAYWEQVDAPTRPAASVSRLDGHDVTADDHENRIALLEAGPAPEPEPKKAAPRKRAPRASAGE